VEVHGPAQEIEQLRKPLADLKPQFFTLEYGFRKWRWRDNSTASRCFALEENRLMASAFSHAVTALGIGACFYRPGIPKRLWVIGALCSALPDLDVIGFDFGIRYGDFWGHRGFTHSLVFAALLAAVAIGLGFPDTIPAASRSYMWTYVFLATASHGLLDAMTDGGLGVAFFSPFNNDRYFLPWRPILVSPIGVGAFFTDYGAAVLRNEVIWIWVPAGLLAAGAWFLRRARPAEDSCSGT
jgi:inner membrane protein